MTQLWDIVLIAVIAISRHFSDVALFIQHLPPAQGGVRCPFSSSLSKYTTALSKTFSHYESIEMVTYSLTRLA